MTKHECDDLEVVYIKPLIVFAVFLWVLFAIALGIWLFYYFTVGL